MSQTGYSTNHRGIRDYISDSDEDSASDFEDSLTTVDDDLPYEDCVGMDGAGFYDDSVGRYSPDAVVDTNRVSPDDPTAPSYRSDRTLHIPLPNLTTVDAMRRDDGSPTGVIHTDIGDVDITFRRSATIPIYDEQTIVTIPDRPHSVTDVPRAGRNRASHSARDRIVSWTIDADSRFRDEKRDTYSNTDGRSTHHRDGDRTNADSRFRDEKRDTYSNTDGRSTHHRDGDRTNADNRCRDEKRDT